MERGILKPTFNQLDTLSDLYKVPRWVFVSESLPEQYRFSRNFSFRKFRDKYGDFFGNSDIRRVTAMVERLRDLIIELRRDMVEPFDPPVSGSGTSASAAAALVRGWLGCEGESLDFGEWKEKLEEKKHLHFHHEQVQGLVPCRRGAVPRSRHISFDPADHHYQQFRREKKHAPSPCSMNWVTC